MQKLEEVEQIDRELCLSHSHRKEKNRLANAKKQFKCHKEVAEVKTICIGEVKV